jgi:hypothetical protein
MGGVSSGNESTALRNFNMDWQNQQLAREMAGAQSAGGQYGAAMGYGAMQPQFTQAAAQAPIAGQQAMAQWPAMAAQGYAQNIMGSDPYSNIMQQIDPYMRNTFGIFGSSPQFRAQQNAAGVGSIMGGASQLWPYLSSMFGGGAGASGGSDFAGIMGAGAGAVDVSTLGDAALIAATI